MEKFEPKGEGGGQWGEDLNGVDVDQEGRRLWGSVRRGSGVNYGGDGRAISRP